MKRYLLALLIITKVCLYGLGANAQLLQLSSRSFWLTEVGLMAETEDFTGASGSFNDGQTILFDNFSVTGFGDYDASGFGPGNFFTGSLLSGGVDASPPSGFTVNYTTPISAFGFNYGGACTGGCVQLEILGDEFTVASNGSFTFPSDFIGVVATNGETFTEIRVQSAGFSAFGQAESFIADDFSSVSATAAVPEPSTIFGTGIAISLGLLFAGLQIRKNKKYYTN